MRLLLFLFFLMLTACQASSSQLALAPLPSGDVVRGKELFERPVLGRNFAAGCNTCHSLTSNVRLVGPSLAQVATRANTVLTAASYKGLAKTNATYLQESIVRPDVYVVEGFTAGVMYSKFEADLTPQEIADLVAYLLTLQ